MGELIPSGVSIDALNKAKAGATPAPPPAPAYDGPTFRTVVKNASAGEMRVLTDQGTEWFMLSPGAEVCLVSWSPRTRLAPFSKLTYEKDGRLSVTRRFGFKDPAEEAPYSILLDNRDGAESESLMIGGEYVEAHRGLPRLVAVPLVDPKVVYKAIRWVKKTVKVPAPGHRDYLITRQIIEKVMVPRKASEIRAIKHLLEKQALDEARRSAARRFKGVIGGPETDDADTPSAE